MKRTTRPAKALVNTEELGRAVRRRREELGLSLRDVADKTSVSASTLSRIENGTGKPDADNIARLTAWLDVPVERILNTRSNQDESSQAVVYYPQEPVPEIVEAHLRADRNLTPPRCQNSFASLTPSSVVTLTRPRRSGVNCGVARSSTSRREVA
jgi:transcriptional regulator with XRE-family HTH domain